MLIKRNGVVLAHAKIERVIGCDGCGVITLTATAPTADTFTITLLQPEMIEIARAYDDTIVANSDEEADA